MALRHEHMRDLLVTDFGHARLPLSAWNFWQTVPRTKKGTADRRTPQGQAWKNYLDRNETHMARQYAAGVPVGEMKALEWGAKTDIPEVRLVRP